MESESNLMRSRGEGAGQSEGKPERKRGEAGRRGWGRETWVGRSKGWRWRGEAGLAAHGNEPSHSMRAREPWRWYEGGTGKVARRLQLQWREGVGSGLRGREEQGNGEGKWEGWSGEGKVVRSSVLYGRG